jgi:hypothetical protein
MTSEISEIELRFPSSIYYADPYAAIRSILGNDVEIISFSESNVVLPDSTILVNVEYSSIDFDAFKLWEVEETKIISQQSQKVVATKLKDTITGDELDSASKDKNLAPKIVVISNYTPKTKLIFIKYLDRINVGNGNIKYYGYSPQSKSDILHSYCSIIDTEFLSYHGSKLKTPKSAIPKSSKLNLDLEIKAIDKLSNNGIETNNFTNSIIALNNLLNSADNIRLNDTKILPEITIQDIPTTNGGFISFSNYTVEELKKAFVGQKGLLIMSKFRDNISSVLYLNTSQMDNIVITEQAIDNLLLVIDYDNYNLNLFMKYNKN